MSVQTLQCLVFAAILIVGSRAHADRLELAGGVQDSVTIQTIRGAEVFFLNARGQLQRAAVGDVRSLGFDSLSALDAAERAWLRNDVQTATEQWIRAMVNARTEVQRLWIHARLARAHDQRGEPIRAASHAARVLLTDAAAYWSILVPESTLEDGAEIDPLLAREAWWAIDRLLRCDAAPEVKAAAERLAALVRPLHERAQQAQPGVVWREGSSISGFAMNDLQRSDWRLPPSNASNVETPVRPSTPPGGSAPTPNPGTPNREQAGPNSPDAIDELLQTKRFSEAVTMCERVARDPADRSLSRFLLQYGRALSGANRPRDAAIRLMQCAIHFAESDEAPAALMETALLYRSHFDQPQTAQRLLQRAMTLAEARGLTELTQQLRNLQGSGS